MSIDNKPVKIEDILAILAEQANTIRHVNFKNERYLHHSFSHLFQNKFDFLKGGVVCEKCIASKDSLTISESCIKILWIAIDNDFEKIIKIKIPNNLKKEIKNTVDLFLQFQV